MFRTPKRVSGAVSRQTRIMQRNNKGNASLEMCDMDEAVEYIVSENKANKTICVEKSEDKVIQEDTGGNSGRLCEKYSGSMSEGSEKEIIIYEDMECEDGEII
ncbi:hypothetical protein PV325_005750 [Microctonus aethiopoides]|uniref:Uncharacterized protein n=1 Tax=Microctonus aethiopoides TaxID=144406 RepID=A0AA39KX26_9HYME|nr:hypothetical protein PV325_005750 [Microctonus aethiopoides]KAK0176949.1 hypothetical protein PV328_001047 [Microctonus aethiopoides]